MKPSKGLIVLAVFIITIGIGDLLSTLGVLPDVDWVWTLALAIVGVLVIVASGGFDKVSVVVGPLLITAAVFSILRQTGHLDPKIETSLIIILIGVLLFISQSSRIPPPRWLSPPRDTTEPRKKP